MHSYPFLSFLLVAAPKIALALAGIVAAVIFRARHPRASILVSLGMLALIANAVAGSAAQSWLVANAPPADKAVTQYAFSLSIAADIVQGIGLVLITLAVFVDRQPIGASNNSFESDALQKTRASS